MGTATHVLHFTFGMPALYQGRSLSIGGVAAYDLMASPYGFYNDASRPGSVGAYTKQLAGWATITEITTDTGPAE
jgi:hypothetical protein